MLKGTQPIILVLGRSLYKQIPDELIKPLKEERLLIVSVVLQTINRQSVNTALIRNKYIIEKAIEVVFGSLDEKGNLYQIYLEQKGNKNILIL